MNSLVQSTSPLLTSTVHVLDLRSVQANGAPLSSVNFVTQSLRNAVSFADANVVRKSIRGLEVGA